MSLRCIMKQAKGYSSYKILLGLLQGIVVRVAGVGLV